MYYNYTDLDIEKIKTSQHTDLEKYPDELPNTLELRRFEKELATSWYLKEQEQIIKIKAFRLSKIIRILLKIPCKVEGNTVIIKPYIFDAAVDTLNDPDVRKWGHLRVCTEERIDEEDIDLPVDMDGTIVYIRGDESFNEKGVYIPDFPSNVDYDDYSDPVVY